MVEEVNLLILARRWKTRRARLNNYVGVLSPDKHTALDAASSVTVVLGRGLIASTMFPKPHLRWLARQTHSVARPPASRIKVVLCFKALYSRYIDSLSNTRNPKNVNKGIIPSMKPAA